MSEIETFTCAACGETFPKKRSDDETWDEAHELFGKMPMECFGIVCDVCWKKLMAV